MNYMDLLIVFLLGVLVGSMLVPRIVEGFSSYSNTGLLLSTPDGELVNIRALDNNRNSYLDTTFSDLVSFGKNLKNNLKKDTAVVMTEQELLNIFEGNTIFVSNLEGSYNRRNTNIILPNRKTHFVFYVVKEGDNYKALKITEIPNIEKLININLLNELRELDVYKETDLIIERVGNLHSVSLRDRRDNSIIRSSLRQNIKRKYNVDYIPFVALRLE
jgi:hypothetical protein